MINSWHAKNSLKGKIEPSPFLTCKGHAVIPKADLLWWTTCPCLLLFRIESLARLVQSFLHFVQGQTSIEPKYSGSIYKIEPAKNLSFFIPVVNK